jgi:hypothetical protein
MKSKPARNQNYEQKKKAVLTSKLSYAHQAAQKIQQQLRIEFTQALCKSKSLVQDSLRLHLILKQTKFLQKQNVIVKCSARQGNVGSN